MAGQQIAEQRLGEKLLVLNNQVTGLLTRLHLTKSYLFNPVSRPEYLNKSNKFFESAQKALVKNFPNVNQKHANNLQTLTNIRNDILRDMSPIYYNFVDVLDLRNHIIELLGCLSGAQIQLDILINFDLTRNYFDLISNYFSLIYFFCQFEDRSLIVAMFNHAYTSKNSIQEDSFPRLSQLILDFSVPLKQLHSDLYPYSSVLSKALESLTPIYLKRQTRCSEWLQSQPFSLLAEAQKLSEPIVEKIRPTDLLSGDDVERWIIFGYLMIHPELGNPGAVQLWKLALSNSFVITLFRDAVVEIHPIIIQYFEVIKHYAKKVTDIKEYMASCYSYSPQFHKEKRRYLRVAMKELTWVFTDQPGLLGPKIHVLLLALSYARDELLWLVRHASNLPSKKSSAVKINTDKFVDQGIVEYLSHMEDLRDVCKNNSDVLKLYYLKTLSGYDSPFIMDCISTLSALPSKETEIISDIANTLSQLSSHVDGNNLVLDTPNLSSVRMDWFRLQIYLSAGKNPVPFKELHPLFLEMNATVFNTKMVDYLEGVLESTSDLSFFFFYIPTLQEYFQKARVIPAQHRYIISLSRICSHFSHICHEQCPEEFEEFREAAFKFACQLCRDISREVCQALFRLVPQLATYAYELLPKEAINWIVVSKDSGKKRGKGTAANQCSGGKNVGGVQEKNLPGTESVRKYRETMTPLDQLMIVVAELCTAINSCREICIFDRIIYPTEIFLFDLKERVRKFFGDLVIVDRESNIITRPTEVLNNLSTQLNVFMNLENYLPISITRVFEEAFRDHSLLKDGATGKVTLTGRYVYWYIEVMIPYLCSDAVLYSTIQKTFVPKRTELETTNDALLHYVDINEMKALAELLSADGISLLSELIVTNLASIWEELRRLLLVNRQTLDDIWHSCSDGNTKRQQELATQLLNSQDIIDRLRRMGTLLIFRRMLKQALNPVLKARVPFLIASVQEMHHMSRDLVHLIGESAGSAIGERPLHGSLEDHLSASRLSSAMGFPVEEGLAADAELVSALHQEAEGDYILGCLLPVCLASLLPRIARSEGCQYRADLGAHANNLHCIVPAVVTLVNIHLISTLHVDELENQWKTFLTLSTTNLLPLEQEAVTGIAPLVAATGKPEPPLKNREAVYILLDMIIQQCPYLSYNQLELCFPYALIRSAYHNAVMRH